MPNDSSKQNTHTQHTTSTQHAILDIPCTAFGPAHHTPTPLRTSAATWLASSALSVPCAPPYVPPCCAVCVRGHVHVHTCIRVRVRVLVQWLVTASLTMPSLLRPQCRWVLHRVPHLLLQPAGGGVWGCGGHVEMMRLHPHRQHCHSAQPHRCRIHRHLQAPPSPDPEAAVCSALLLLMCTAIQEAVGGGVRGVVGQGGHLK